MPPLRSGNATGSDDMATTMNSTRAFSGRKVHKWRDYLESEVGWPVDFSGYDEETFEAQIEFARYGSISLRSNWISPVIANRRPAHVAPMKEQAFLLSLHLTGELVMSQYGVENRIRAGDIMFTDVTAPGRLRYERPTNTLCLRLPRDMLANVIPDPERFCNLPISSRMGYGSAVREMLLAMWRERGGVSEADSIRSASLLLDITATVFARTYGRDAAESSIAAARLFSIKQHIERELRDPDLRPAAVAESLGISHRYICKLFALEADSAMRYIQRRRLEKCASQLSSPMWRGHTISEIAFSWGFNSSAHFTRSFRAHFGCTPRQYRTQATAPPRLKNATAKFM